MKHNLTCIRCENHVTIDQWAHEKCPVPVFPIKSNGKTEPKVFQFHTVSDGHTNADNGLPSRAEEILRSAYRSEQVVIPDVVR